MRIILIVAFFLLPISAVAAMPLNNDAKAGLNIHEMHKNANIHKLPHQHIHDRSVVFHRED
jgi:hypothetical protein